MLKDIYNILYYFINLFILRKRFARVLFILILFYKTYLSRLNLIVSSSSLNTSISSLSIDKLSSLASSSSPSISSLIFKSLKNFLNIVNSFIESFFNEAFANKNEKKKKNKEKKKEEENEKIRDIKKKVNKNKRF